MYATFSRFEIQLTKAHAESAGHAGECDAAVAALSKAPAIARQLRKLDPDAVRAELRGYGAWDEGELADHGQNLQRVLWLAAGSVTWEDV